MSSPCVNERSPSETAVAATTSEIVNPTVAISSIVAARRREAVFSFRAGAKPGIPVSSAMAVVLANHLFRGHKIAADWGGAIEE
jgi:hypothetical protein